MRNLSFLSLNGPCRPGRVTTTQNQLLQLQRTPSAFSSCRTAGPLFPSDIHLVHKKPCSANCRATLAESRQWCSISPTDPECDYGKKLNRALDLRLAFLALSPLVGRYAEPGAPDLPDCKSEKTWIPRSLTSCVPLENRETMEISKLPMLNTVTRWNPPTPASAAPLRLRWNGPSNFINVLAPDMRSLRLPPALHSVCGRLFSQLSFCS
jgi:hypothetical protein